MKRCLFLLSCILVLICLMGCQQKDKKKQLKSISESAWPSLAVETKKKETVTLDYVSASMTDESVALFFKQTENSPKAINDETQDYFTVLLPDVGLDYKVTGVFLGYFGTKEKPYLMVTMSDGTAGYVDITAGIEDEFSFSLTIISEINNVNHFEVLKVNDNDKILYSILAILNNSTAVDISKYI